MKREETPDKAVESPERLVEPNKVGGFIGGLEIIDMITSLKNEIRWIL